MTTLAIKIKLPKAKLQLLQNRVQIHKRMAGNQIHCSEHFNTESQVVTNCTINLQFKQINYFHLF